MIELSDFALSMLTAVLALCYGWAWGWLCCDGAWRKRYRRRHRE